MKYLFCLLVVSSSMFAQDKSGKEIVPGQEVVVNGKKIIYTYKQFEKFDFDDLNIEGDSGSPNDISISPTHEIKMANRLPYRKSFNAEIRKGIERVR